MRIHIGTDHAAFELKEYLVAELGKLGHELVDHGAVVYDGDDDYPDFILPCAEAVVETGELGIVLGGSGNGEQIAANKVKGCRAVLAYSPELARLGREHNNANVVSVGGRFHENDEALEIVKAFLETDFSGNPRHARRIDMLNDYEDAHRA